MSATSFESRTLKALIAQARLNSDLINALGELGKNARMEDFAPFIKALQGAAEQSTEFVKALDAAVDTLGGQ